MTTPRRILVLFAHPALERSRVQRRLLTATEGLPYVTVHDLYEQYPDLMIDVRREHALLDAHDVIVFQHPFYWYSAPAILKEWQDLVLLHGWAFGTGGHHLRDKVTLNVVSTGGSSEAYSGRGHLPFTVRQLLAPYEATARLCGLRFLPPFVVPDALRLSGGDDMTSHVARYRRLLERLAHDQVDLARAADADTLTEQA
jgi:glutathione-regulated potassium-efflux system ancillary protein KefG